MDTSEAYIKMCEKAEEIQKSWILKEGDSSYSPVIVHDKPHLEEHLYHIWLPRQDQLQEMVGDYEFCFNFMGRFFYYDVGAGGEPVVGIDFDGVTSMEQLWLAFVMKERYQKIWSGTEWVIQTPQ